ncbi:MAG: preprotein translocase subunit SecG [Myxococcaceae bacterium]
MLPFVSTIHILLCVFMIFVILLQPGKDAGMGAAFGGGAATSAFGGRGAVTFLGKVTAVCAVAFFVTSLGLSFVGLRKSVAGSIVAPKPAATDTKKDAPSAPAQGASDSKTGDVNKADADKGAAPAALPPPSGTEAVPADKAPEEKK